MENIDVASSDKVSSVAQYGELDRDIAIHSDISRRESSPSGKAMDRQREAQEYIRNRRAQAKATVVDEADEDIMVAPSQITSRDTEANEQKLLASLASKYNYNLYQASLNEFTGLRVFLTATLQSKSAKIDDPKSLGNSGSPIASENTNTIVQPHRKEPSLSSNTRQQPDGHNPWHRSRSSDRSNSPLRGNHQRSPSPSVQQTESTQITPSPPPPIPTAPISDFRPGAMITTSQMPYPSQHPRSTYNTNLRQYGERSNRLPASKPVLDRPNVEGSIPGNANQLSVQGISTGHLSERYRQIGPPQQSKSQSPQATTQWAAPKPARANSNLVQNLQDSQILKNTEQPLQNSRPPPDSYLAHSGQDISPQGMEQGHDAPHHRVSELWNQNSRIPQQNFSPPDSLSSNSRRQMAYGVQNNAHGNPETFVHTQHPSMPQNHYGSRGREVYMPESDNRVYSYDNHSQEAFSSQTTLPNPSNFTPSSHGNSIRGHVGDYSSDHHFEPALEGRRPALHASASSPTMHRHTDHVDWRAQLCQLFNAPHESHDEDLFKMLHMSRTKLTLSDKPDFDAERFTLPYHTIHRVRCRWSGSIEMFLDVPSILYESPGGPHLQGSIFVRNIALHTQQYTNLAFIVYKDYACCSAEVNPSQARLHVKASGKVEPDVQTSLAQFIKNESICLISDELSAGLKRLTRQNIHENSYYPSFNLGTEFQAPYLWFYHQRAPLEERRRQLKPELLSRVNSFVEYVNETLGQEYAVVDSLLSKGMVSPKYLRYLYSPETIVLRTDKENGEMRKRAFLTKSWLHSIPSEKSELSKEYMVPGSSLVVSSWTFDGLFQEHSETIVIEDSKKPEEVIKINSLAICPMRFADPAVATSLRKQGEMFWKFRRGCYVYYSQDDEAVNENVGQSRYMIDVEAFKRLHPELQNTKTPNKDDLGPAAMASDIPPEGVFTLLLPSKIIGFSMHEMKWVDLNVDQIYPIKWSKEAFQLLAAEENTKLLVTALVANQITEEQPRGVMSTKGDGSIVLFHGASGTGKTLMAESVAEIAEKPLYRVECNELGNTPEELGKALEQILYLGKIWNCVVLLEEAEIFLEKRTLGDFRRNALVSVFLRALESYNGVLILTSSPIISMDPVVKSRIQLSLCFHPLTPSQRLKVWETHITQLESLESLFTPSTINIAVVRANLPRLAKYRLNGHEIGHAIKSARQLAVWKGVPMGIEEVEYVVEAAEKLDTVDETLSQAGEVAKGAVGAGDDNLYNGLDGGEDLMNV